MPEDGVAGPDHDKEPSTDGDREPSNDEGASADENGTTGTFLVTEADEETAVLRDIRTSQVHTLTGNPDLQTGDILEATIAPEPPLEVAWEVLDIKSCREIPVERSPEPPTKQARDIAAGQDVGDVARRERAGDGELHVLSVPEEETDVAADDVIEDEVTVVRAAKLSVDRVEVRAADGVLCVRYLP